MNTLENNSLKEALLYAADSELDALELMADSAPHSFSEDFISRMDKVIEMSGHRYSTFFRRRIRHSSMVAIVAVLILCMAVTACAIIKNIPISVTYDENDYPGLLIERSDDTEARDSFEYIIPVTPEGFEVIEKFEEPTYLTIMYENPSDWSFSKRTIIYSQYYADGGHAELNVPDSDQAEVREETINGRNAVIRVMDKNNYEIIIEDGKNVFAITGFCDYEIMYDMAVDVTSADRS